MDLELKGKTVIVTGGASNIGKAISMQFAKEGANVAIADWDEVMAQKAVTEMQALGVKGVAVKTDVSNWDSVQNMVKKVLAEMGQIDILVNNAAWGRDRLFVEKPREEWEKEINIDLWGVINCIRAVLDHMIQRQTGCIVSIGSDAGRMGEFREGVYAACKAGVIALSKSVAREVGKSGIRLNVVCPGLTPPRAGDTSDKGLWAGMDEVFTPASLEKAKKLYPLRKLGTQEDIAYAVCFMASDRCAGHVTGQTLSVSGGYTMI